MISAGKVTARATGASIGLTKSGKEQIGIAFDILDGPDAGQSITCYGSFSDAAIGYTLDKMRTAGWRGDDLADLSSIGGEGTPDVQLVIEHEEYEGKISAKVKFINPVNGGGVAMQAVLDTSAQRAFAARMRGKVLAHNKSASSSSSGPATKPAPRPPARPAPARSAEPPPPSDNDAPPDFGDEDRIPY